MSHPANRAARAVSGVVVPLRAPSDADLVARAVDGDRWATGALYRRHLTAAMRTAVRLLRNRAEAEDVVQDAFVRAFANLSQLRDPGAFRPWVLRIVVTGVHRRFRRRRPLPVDRLAEAVAQDAGPEVRAELRLLDHALDRVRPRDRIAWTLRYVLGHSLEEVASQCGCSLATAKRRIRAARSIIDRHVSLETHHD